MLYESPENYTLEGFDGKEVAKAPVEPIVFECPACAARHDRGPVTTSISPGMFMCQECGYSGYGFHIDPEIDRAAFDEWKTNNDWNLAHGIPPVPLGVDPLNGPG